MQKPTGRVVSAIIRNAGSLSAPSAPEARACTGIGPRSPGSAERKSAAPAMTSPAETPSATSAPAVATMAAVFGFCVLLPWIGYVVTTFLFVGLVYWRLGEMRWSRVMLTAVASAAISYYVFAVALGVPLPRGVLFD